MSFDEKLIRLKKFIKDLRSIVVAYSGGIDSTLVLKVAVDVLGKDVVGVTADSPSVPRKELKNAKRIASNIGARHRIIRTDEFDNTNYTKNQSNRCYYCKSELYGKLLEVAQQEEMRHIVNGTNVDDLNDHRPGLKAAKKFNVISPLVEIRFTKKDVRILAEKLKIETWDKPASPCLSSRLPYGSVVTAEKLSKIEDAESFLDNLGILERRVRHFGDKARLEVREDDFRTIESNYKSIKQYFKKLGFEFLEVTKFRSGVLNDVLALNVEPHVSRPTQSTTDGR